MSDGEKKVAIQTSRFGTIEAPEEKGISISGGLLGFPESTRYLMLDHDQDSPFKWLQSMDEGEVAFVVTDPLVFFPEYQVQIRKDELAGLQIEDGDTPMVFVILSLAAEPENMTANLQGPIIINARTRIGRQVVLKDSEYKTKHPLFAQTA
ncbi:MAG: flagellar assembly protein FliW [Deltaproteobacteria bacterium]|nr:flagellar assembly protein FliW [bacterium]MCB9478820.1 flagellar assembly protein FliW [Deltaproteobacteria bacterium]MCB9489018.1 flagellar assembly protein FliW [Deltaproteobacteria bacterium]